MNPRPSKWLGRISVNPDICNGKPTIRGTRITAATVLEYLGAGDSPDEILGQYPSLELDDILACMDLAAETLDHRFVVVAPSI